MVRGHWHETRALALGGYQIERRRLPAGNLKVSCVSPAAVRPRALDEFAWRGEAKVRRGFRRCCQKPPRSAAPALGLSWASMGSQSALQKRAPWAAASASGAPERI
jgi:hypothetical protein